MKNRKETRRKQLCSTDVRITHAPAGTVFFDRTDIPPWDESLGEFKGLDPGGAIEVGQLPLNLEGGVQPAPRRAARGGTTNLRDLAEQRPPIPCVEIFDLLEGLADQHHAMAVNGGREARLEADRAQRAALDDADESVIDEHERLRLACSLRAGFDQEFAEELTSVLLLLVGEGSPTSEGRAS